MKITNWSIFAIMLYVQIFANSLNNSYVDIIAGNEGKVVWRQEIFQADEENNSVGFLLTSGKHIFVVTGMKIFGYDSSGKLLWDRATWIHSPVKIRDKKLYFLAEDSKSTLQAVDFENNKVMDDLWIPELVAVSYLTLLEPLENGIIAQVQYRPDPDSGEYSFVIYRMEMGKLGMEWERTYEQERSKVIPVVDISNQLLVTSTMKDVLVFHLQNSTKFPDPMGTFPLPQGDNSIWLSLSNLELFWLGQRENQTRLNVTDIKGNLIWQWASDEADFDRYAYPIQPAIVSPDICFILTHKKLYALRKGNLLWEIDSDNVDFSFATAVAGSSVIVAKGSEILLINSKGKIEFQLDIEEKIVTAPVVDENGNIYVAGEDHLYCIK